MTTARPNPGGLARSSAGLERRGPTTQAPTPGAQPRPPAAAQPGTGLRGWLGVGGSALAWLWRRRGVALVVALLCLAAGAAHAQAGGANPLPFRVTIDGSNQPQDLDVGIKILFAITLLSLAPSLILLMTCFTRIIIVLSFVRTALQLQGAPANQIIVGLSLFMTFFIMAPVWETIQREAVAPYQAKQITSEQALERATAPIRTFMLKQARAKDVELFVGLARMAPTQPDQLPLKVVVPGFIISELRTAFQMGFLLLVPFILIDLVVAVVLMSMGMMMMPPMTIALPLKILLFVLADGWGLVVRSIIQSFGT
jgi:flagellar biosynthetic protein FliP